MRKELLMLLAFTASCFSAPGIDPKHPELTESKKNELYKKCKAEEGTKIEACEQAMLYDMHLKQNVHKGVDEGDFSSYAGKWLGSLDVAVAETDLFIDINRQYDTSLMNANQAGISLSSMGYDANRQIQKFAETVDSYEKLMDIIVRQTKLEHTIETILTQILLERETEAELKSFYGEKK